MSNVDTMVRDKDLLKTDAITGLEDFGLEPAADKDEASNLLRMAMQEIIAGNFAQALENLSRAKQFLGKMRNFSLIESLALVGLGRIDEGIKAVQLELKYFPDNDEAKILNRRLSDD